MSSSLIWTPVNKEANDLPDQLKYVLQKRYGSVIDAIFTINDYGYLSGLIDAGIDGADELLKAVSKHEEVRVKEVF